MGSGGSLASVRCGLFCGSVVGNRGGFRSEEEEEEVWITEW